VHLDPPSFLSVNFVIMSLYMTKTVKCSQNHRNSSYNVRCWTPIFLMFDLNTNVWTRPCLKSGRVLTPDPRIGWKLTPTMIVRSDCFTECHTYTIIVLSSCSTILPIDESALIVVVFDIGTFL